MGPHNQHLKYITQRYVPIKRAILCYVALTRGNIVLGSLQPESSLAPESPRLVSKLIYSLDLSDKIRFESKLSLKMLEREIYE